MNGFDTHEEVRLTESEKARMRSVVHAYMEMRPRRLPARGYGRPTLRLFLSHRAIAALIVVAVLSSGAGISYAAESALPGDALYPVKTAINEPVRGTLAISAQAKAAWAIQVAGERAKEAVTLAAQDRLDPSIQQELEDSLVEHAQIATRVLDEQAASAPSVSAQVAGRFEARLTEYERLIASVGSSDGDAAPTIAAAIRTERDHVAEVRSRAENTSDSRKHDELELAAKERLSAVDRLVRLNAGAFSTDTADELTATIETASATIANVRTPERTDESQREYSRTIDGSERIATFVETSAAIHERTGLIVDSKKGSRRSGKTAAPIQMAMTMSAPAPLAEVASSSIGATVTSSTHDEEMREDEGHDSDTEEGSEHTIKLSVPSF